MQNRKHSSIACRIEKFIGMPTRRQWPCLAFAVSHNAARQEIRIVEDCAVRVHQGITQFAAFMDRSWRLGGNMAGNTSGKRKLFEQPLHTLFILLNGGVDLGGSRIMIKISNHARHAMHLTAHLNEVNVINLDAAFKVNE